MLSAEEIEANFSKFKTYALQTGDHRQEQLTKFLDHFEERLALCPGSSNTHFHNCFPGGLVEHSLRVLRNCNRLAQAFKDEFEISRESMIFACLFHDIGKVGDVTEPRYVTQTNEWHAKQGKMYEFNKKMSFLTTPPMGIFILQHFGVPMNFEEFQSILLNDGQYDDANRPYALKEHPLALLVHQADCLATVMEKRQ